MLRKSKWLWLQIFFPCKNFKEGKCDFSCALSSPKGESSDCCLLCKKIKICRPQFRCSLVTTLIREGKFPRNGLSNF